MLAFPRRFFFFALAHFALTQAALLRTQQTQESQATDDYMYAVGISFAEQSSLAKDISFPFKPHHHGVSFHRTVNNVAGGSIALTLKDGATHCSSHDQYGDNDCNYKWSETMELTLSSSLGVDLVAGDQITGEFEIDVIAHLSFACDVCGKPCVINVPRINQHISIDTPPCPISGKDFVYTFVQALPGPELIPPVIAKGNIKLVRHDGTSVVDADAEIKVLT